MPFSRRNFLFSTVAGAATGLLASTRALAQRLRPLGASGPPPKPDAARRQSGRVPVLTPNGTTLPFRTIDGV
ncbi:MAG: copper oxidase, partial [Thermoanaerobaculia bacterium]